MRTQPLVRSLAAIGFAVTVATLLIGCGGCDKDSDSGGMGPPPVTASDYELQRLYSGLSSPVDLQAAPGDTSRIFIVEKTGLIRIAKHGVLLDRPFLDIHTLVSGGSEQGLLGLAFHPSFSTNGKFYVDYTDTQGDTRVASYQVSSDPDSAIPAGTIILPVDQPYENHNGGQIAFGPDGFLYIALGDGGSGGDPNGNGQSLGALLGKILRIDVDGGSPYAVPASNPFVGQAGARGEIWSYGLRNPWRFSFDKATNAMWIGDVGQEKWEEIDYEPAATGGRNYGWNIMEGNHCYPAGTSCNMTGITKPIAEYGHASGLCSVTGGYVYRGTDMPELAGTYFYGDYCTGMIRSLRLGPAGTVVEAFDWTSVLRRESGGALTQLTSLGVDARGELYFVTLDGEVYRLRKKP